MTRKINYSMISLLQFLFAVLVIAFHSARIFPSEEWNYIQKNIISRLAVPFFIIASAFFVRWKTSINKDFEKKYIKKYIKSYLLWSLIYLPYAFMYFRSLGLPKTYLPVGIFAAIFYIGMCYHLWYLPAFLFGSWLVKQCSKQMQLLSVTLFAFLLFLIGSIETYAGYLSGTSIADAYDTYAQVLFTTRNGLFYTPIFICIGYLLYDYRNHRFVTERQGIKLIGSFLILCGEAWFIFKNPGVDKNFLIGLIPMSFFLFNWSMRTEWFKQKDGRRLKQLSVMYFFIHPAFIELLLLTPLDEVLTTYQYAWVSLVIVLLGTHLSAVGLLKIQTKRMFFIEKWQSIAFQKNRL